MKFYVRSLIPELKGLLNSKCDEQLHYVSNRDTRFLNQMQPLNNIFMFRYNLDIFNIKMNQSVIYDICKSISFKLSFDHLRRIIINKTNRKKAKTATHYYNIMCEEKQGRKEREESLKQLTGRASRPAATKQKSNQILDQRFKSWK